MKIVIHSSSPKHGLLNLDGHFLMPGRPVCAKATSLVEQRMAKNDFRLLIGNLDDAATDAELLEFLKDSGDEKLALASFESKFSMDPEKRSSEGDDAQAKREKESKDKADAELESKEKADKLAKEQAGNIANAVKETSATEASTTTDKVTAPNGSETPANPQTATTTASPKR